MQSAEEVWGLPTATPPEVQLTVATSQVCVGEEKPSRVLSPTAQFAPVVVLHVAPEGPMGDGVNAESTGQAGWPAPPQMAAPVGAPFTPQAPAYTTSVTVQTKEVVPDVSVLKAFTSRSKVLVVPASNVQVFFGKKLGFVPHTTWAESSAEAVRVPSPVAAQVQLSVAVSVAVPRVLVVHC